MKMFQRSDDSVLVEFAKTLEFLAKHHYLDTYQVLWDTGYKNLTCDFLQDLREGAL